MPSLPSRGAWIEMSVGDYVTPSTSTSLPSRGAWIEMVQAQVPQGLQYVAPLAGSVDRNVLTFEASGSVISRSPRGERG